ncbi:hypothetical protein ACWATR_31950 [Nostoc sp. UIC 10890]
MGSAKSYDNFARLRLHCTLIYPAIAIASETTQATTALHSLRSLLRIMVDLCWFDQSLTTIGCHALS